MSTLFLIVDKNPTAALSKKTESSIKSILEKEDGVIFKISDEFEHFYQFKPEEVYDFVCLIPNHSEINENYATILKDYKETEERQEKIIYLPLVVLLLEKTKGVLNECLWNPNLVEEVGVLTPSLAKLQVDTTLFGALIPFETFFDENNYDKDLKYYQHFYFLNKVTADEENNLVFGVPKTLVFTDVDLSFPGVTKEEKIKYFKQAREI